MLIFLQVLMEISHHFTNQIFMSSIFISMKRESIIAYRSRILVIILTSSLLVEVSIKLLSHLSLEKFNLPALWVESKDTLFTTASGSNLLKLLWRLNNNLLMIFQRLIILESVFYSLRVPVLEVAPIVA